MTTRLLPVYRHGSKEFEGKIAALRARGETGEAAVEEVVRKIIAAVRSKGDAALLDFTARFDGHRPDRLEIPASSIRGARGGIPGPLREALETAAARIEAFHRKQKKRSWMITGEHGERLGQRVRPLARVGVYVPGGRAAYPSSVLMNVIPAKVAGVPEIVMVTPTPGGQLNPVILAAADIAGVDRLFVVGGAQAVAALAHGTASVPKVEKIVGPGNIYVACAKRLLFGTVDIDMVAGPSEIVVIADETADPSFIAADLLSQAEHDPMAYPLLITTEEGLIAKVQDELAGFLADLPTATVARESLGSRGAALVVPDLGEACRLASSLAFEHLELLVAEPRRWERRITAAGAIFLGQFTPEPLGDYVAGPNHVLPTGGTARFFSPLGVYDFQRMSSILEFSREAFEAVGPTAQVIAEAEGLWAHARAVAVRRRKGRGG